MPEIDPRLAHLAQGHGVSTSYVDYRGETQVVSPETIHACLAGLGVDVSGEDWVDRALKDLEDKPWKQPVPPYIVVQQGEEKTINVHVDSGRPAQVWLTEEDGATRVLDQVDNWEPDRMVGDRAVGRASFSIPGDVPLGYHQLTLESDGVTFSTPLIITPSQLTTSQGIDSLWGFMVQLYSICSEGSWGVGDFYDLGGLAYWAKQELGADFILINPTHVCEVTEPMDPSPYYPSTRRYINPIYIRPGQIRQCYRASDEVQATVEAFRQMAMKATSDSELITRDEVWTRKRAALELIFAQPQDDMSEQTFEDFIRSEGSALSTYATWCVLTEKYGQDWKKWPPSFQDPSSQEVRDFVATQGDRLRFHMWLQWVAHQQARGAHKMAQRAGMKVGVLCDLAVGVSQASEEVWARRNLFAPGVTVGAPPDAYNQVGQDWSQPPWSPHRLAQQGYEPVRAMMAALLSDSTDHGGSDSSSSRSGGVRIDHVMGLFRLWWIPQGMSPDQGTYLRYDHEAMVGIIALEAQRAGALVIGEDLGTVEPWVRDYLTDRGVLGTSVVWFEQTGEGLLPPEKWRNLCLASVTTHDLPPTLGYLEQSHVQLRSDLGLLTRPLAEELERDSHDQMKTICFLEDRGFLATGQRDPHQVMEALYRFLRSTPAKLKCVALTDALGERRTQNQPGTVDEYPNWRVPLGDHTGKRLMLEDIYQMESVRRIADLMNGKDQQ
ncbi:MAG: 4-alpha-glucanotransferase [Propionibacteriaceae bacterium]|nr:4-alpha-glucanotransferase [Propionibacteriaceae bacterium]